MIQAALRRPTLGALRDYQRFAQQRIEAAALHATDKAARNALISIREGMAGAKLGRLGNALGSGSDLRASGKIVKRRGKDGFSASGWVFIRSRSERALGAIEAYTEGADIKPVRGKWLWIATDEIPSRVKRYRMTPKRYVEAGLDKKIGPLVLVKSINGRPLLVVKDASVNAAGKSRSAKALRRNGQPRAGQRPKTFIVAFIGIPRTSRAARLDVRAIVQREIDALPGYFAEAARA